MNLIILLAVSLLAASLGLGLYKIARGNSQFPSDGDNARSLIDPLDVVAFNNLVDPAEEDFLSENLPPPIFRSIQRQRLRAAIEYVMCAAANASVLIKFGRSAQDGDNRELAEQAQEMVTAAVQLRLLSFVVLCILYVKIALPGLRLSLYGISRLHERVVQQLGSVTRLKEVSSRIALLGSR